MYRKVLCLLVLFFGVSFYSTATMIEEKRGKLRFEKLDDYSAAVEQASKEPLVSFPRAISKIYYQLFITNQVSNCSEKKSSLEVYSCLKRDLLKKDEHTEMALIQIKQELIKVARQKIAEIKPRLFQTRVLMASSPSELVEFLCIESLTDVEKVKMFLDLKEIVQKMDKEKFQVVEQYTTATYGYNGQTTDRFCEKN